MQMQIYKKQLTKQAKTVFQNPKKLILKVNYINQLEKITYIVLRPALEYRV